MRCLCVFTWIYMSLSRLRNNPTVVLMTWRFYILYINGIFSKNNYFFAYSKTQWNYLNTSKSFYQSIVNWKKLWFFTAPELCRFMNNKRIFTKNRHRYPISRSKIIRIKWRERKSSNLLQDWNDLASYFINTTYV